MTDIRRRQMIIGSLLFGIACGALQVVFLGQLEAAPWAACVCVYASLALMAAFGGYTMLFPLFGIIVYFLHYVPAPLLARAGIVNYWFCQEYMQNPEWEANYKWSCWGIVLFSAGIVTPLFLPGFSNTARGASTKSPTGWEPAPIDYGSPAVQQFRTHCWIWFLSFIQLYRIGIAEMSGPFQQPLTLLFETRTVAAGALILMSPPKKALIPLAIISIVEGTLATSSGLFAGFFDRTLPLLFLYFYHIRLRWSVVLIVISLVLMLYVNEGKKRSVFRKKLESGEIQGTFGPAMYAFQSWYSLLSDPDELFGMEVRCQFFERMDNQFFLQNALMSQTPRTLDFQHGGRLLKTATSFIPRALYAGKPVMLDHEEFKVLTGYPLAAEISMGFGALGEFYLDYGVPGMLIGMFIFGGLLGLMWRKTNRLAKKSPVWWSWYLYLFGFWITQMGSMMVNIVGRTVKGAIIFLLIYHAWGEMNALLSPADDRGAGDQNAPRPHDHHGAIAEPGAPGAGGLT